MLLITVEPECGVNSDKDENQFRCPAGQTRAQRFSLLFHRPYLFAAPAIAQTSRLPVTLAAAVVLDFGVGRSAFGVSHFESRCSSLFALRSLAPCSLPLAPFSLLATVFLMPRCPWATTEPNITYHDQEWGVPVHDDRKLFEFLILEGAQAGLSWTTILKKRENYRKAFDGFRAEKIARYGARDVKRLLGDTGIVRNRLKIAATIQNAKAFLAVRKEFGSFDAYLWSFVGGKPKQNRWRKMSQVPARTTESDAMSRDLLGADSSSSAQRSATR